MSVIEIALLGVSLAMDAFAVSITTGITLKDLRWKHALKVGLFFGGFQFLMPLIGYLAGSTFVRYIESVDHWIAFGLLAFIGGKMVYECIRPGEEEQVANPTATGKLLVLAVATSIDAFAVGVSFAAMQVAIISSAALIGITTCLLSAIGVKVGALFGDKYRAPAERIGGIVLILIGVKTLLTGLGVL